MNPYIIGLSGSPEKNSLTAAAVNYALRGAQAAGAKTKLLQLNEYKLLIAGSVDESEYPDDLLLLRNELKKADGIIIGTPEHNSSISGILKNAIDLLGKTAFENKVTGLIGLAGGAAGAISSLNNLMIICRSLHSWVSPHVVSIANAHKVFDSQQKIKEVKILKRLFQLGYLTAMFACNLMKINSDLLCNLKANLSAINAN
jgi:NAD(P)H-dependent FMN reductase